MDAAVAAEARKRIGDQIEMPFGPAGCWFWTGRLNHAGYGRFKFMGVRWMAHRLSLAAHAGVDVRGAHVHHKCWERACVSPLHLETLSAEEHGLRTVEDRRARGLPVGV